MGKINEEVNGKDISYDAEKKCLRYLKNYHKDSQIQYKRGSSVKKENEYIQ